MSGLLALVALGLAIWLGPRVARRGQWRPVAAVLALAVFVAAAWTGVRGEWPVTIAFVLAGCALAFGARKRG